MTTRWAFHRQGYRVNYWTVFMGAAIGLVLIAPFITLAVLQVRSGSESLGAASGEIAGLVAVGAMGGPTAGLIWGKPAASSPSQRSFPAGGLAVPLVRLAFE